MDNNIDFIKNHPYEILSATETLIQQFKENLKKCYDFSKSQEIESNSNCSALSKLVIDGFDLEQIWQQIDLQNDFLLTKSLPTVSKLVVNKKSLIFKNPQENTVEESNLSDENDDINMDSEEEENEDCPDLNDDEIEDLPEENDQLEETSEKNIKPSVVDDDFFKLNEMEAFLNAEEKKMNDPDSGNDTENSESESGENVDLFEQSDNEDEDEDTDKVARYKDFFVSNKQPKKMKQNKFAQKDEEVLDEEPKSSFELRQERLNQKIEEIEEEAINDKPWQLKGEITADSRPQNSLLEEVLEFDMTSRPAPVMTEKTTFQLEDIIKQRIKDKVFDSVERKVKPIDTPLEYKKKLVLDQEKSKESLAQIYEKEYLEQKAALNPDVEKVEEEPELHKEIDKMMNNLFRQLDALSNFYFTPRAAVPELKIISNLPAINMEEVAPVSASDATLLAPEEVKKKTKSDIIGKNERTTTDKKRERRKKKLKQKIHAKLKEKRESTKKNGKEKFKKDGNVKEMNEKTDTKHLKSSTSFFTQLEEQVKTQIKLKAQDKRRNKKDSNLDPKKMKL